MGNRNCISERKKRWSVGSLHARFSPHTKNGGPDADGAFRSYLLDYNVISLVHPHPTR